MKLHYKRFTAHLGMLCLLVPVIFSTTGCGTTSSKEIVYEEPLVIDVFDCLANYQGIQCGWFARIVKDKFNMELNIIAPNVAGGGDTLYQTRAAAGNLGDLIICNGSNNNLQNLVTAGLVVDIRPYLEGREIMQYEKAIRALNDTVDDSAIYAIPSAVSSKSCTEPSESKDPSFGPYLRYDIYASIGCPEIQNLDSLLTTLAQMQEAHPVSESGNPTFCFSFFRDWDDNMMTAAKQPACFYGYDEYGFVLAKADGSDFQDILADDSFYMRNLKLYFDANQMGLVDPDSPNQSYSEVSAKYAAGDILYSPWPWLGQATYNTLENRSIGKGFMFVPIDDMQILSNGCMPYGNTDTIIAVGSHAKDPERVADFINWLYSPEGVYVAGGNSISAPGPEGLTWEMTEEGPALTDFGKAAILEGYAQMPEEWGGGTWEDGICQLNFTTVSLIDIAPNGYPYYYREWRSYLDSENTALELAWKNHMQANSTLEYLENHNQLLVSPGCSYQDPEEPNEITTIRSQCRSIILSKSWDMIFAKDEETFYSLQEEMQTAVKSLGYDQVLTFDMDSAKAEIAAKLAAAEAENK